ncbi:hypothetical protein PVK06_020444 [Gossypium arboreum]|uniref:Uncharacterized protein n=1 Tax=Gossypium arboreum TaxID=29729 RepID=A0ABR0PMH4_GOSAR|nr:hypothetical protein PVK06_020444 [Gossypium arboreum]
MGLLEKLEDFRSVGKSGDVGCQGVVGSVCDGGNGRIRLRDAAVRVEATNSIATARPEGAAQCGYAGEE